MTHSWPESPPRWLRRLVTGGDGQHNHSNEVEHRLTLLETDTDLQLKVNSKTESRLSRLERAVLGIIAALHALLHDRLPEWSKYLAMLAKGLLHTT